MPDARKHDHHSTPPRLYDVKRTGSLIEEVLKIG